MKCNTSITHVTPYGACALIAHFYGFVSVAKLLKSNEIKVPFAWNFYKSEHVDSLCSIKQIKDDVLDYNLLQRVKVSAFHSTTSLSKQLKVCAKCFKENSLHDVKWQNVSTTICIKHQAPLINVLNLLSLEEDKPHSKEALYSFERHILSLEDVKRRSFENALLKLSESVFRPLDFITAKLKLDRVNIEFLRLLFEDAYKLLCCEELSDVWEGLLLKHRRHLEGMGQLVARFGINELQAQIESFNIKKGLTSSAEAKNILLKYHNAKIDTKLFTSKRRFDNGANLNQLSYQVDGLMLSNFLGIKKESLIYVVNNRTLPAVYLGCQAEKSFFDIEVIGSILAKSFAQNTQIEAQEQFYKIDDIPKDIYNLFDLTVDELVDYAISGKIESQFKVNSSLRYVNYLLISENGIKKVLKNKWQSFNDMAHESVIKMLKLDKKTLLHLIDNGFLVIAKDKALIDADSIRHFVSNHLVLNRTANFERSRDCEKRVRDCCKAEPVCLLYMNAYLTDFVVYKKESLNDCCLRKLESRFTYFGKPKLDLSKIVITYQTKPK
ncbi:hypothetical protein H5203_16385 [Pseudoalteromonas sp. SG41-1]|uniref:hypothetical protein n=1 Tax=Pseudoalteromonas sp. SG41-1 TaxID=2760979 RepID=UPI001603D39C|nr:hypothetical protein [Pseudoalteromonas sp. SG41-1]MBB1507057.1 hypothetical protein [Pseudoalteromonas sp. SG41-1]